MRIKLPTSLVSGARRTAKAAFTAVIVYEDFAAAHRAMDTCKHLMSQLEGDVEFRTSMWKFDLLRNIKLSQIAASDAIEADVIIIAASQNSDLTNEVKAWMESWIPAKRGQSAALVALLDFTNEDMRNSCLAHSFLKNAAATAGMDFIARGIQFTDQSASSVAGVLGEVEKPTYTEHVVGRPAPECWGLND